MPRPRCSRCTAHESRPAGSPRWGRRSSSVGWPGADPPGTAPSTSPPRRRRCTGRLPHTSAAGTRNGCRSRPSISTTCGARSRPPNASTLPEPARSPVFQAVSGALEGFPDLRLESLEWFEISDRDEWPPPRNENGPREGYRIAHLRGRLDPFDGHYRAAADEVFRFAEALEEVPAPERRRSAGPPREPRRKRVSPPAPGRLRDQGGAGCSG